MSYRPTVSVHLRGSPVTVGYYRNWSDEDLFIEAAALWALLADCRTVKEVSDRLHGGGPGASTMRELERCSENAVVVDLTRRELRADYPLCEGRCRIPMTRADRGEMLRLFREEPSLLRRCSFHTAALLIDSGAA